ncbi:MAG: tyrosine-type recombinase/integrase [Anaerolineales bacterium]
MTTIQPQNHTIILSNNEDYIEQWVQIFLSDKKSQNLSNHTLRFYANNLKVFVQYCENHSLKRISQLTPPFLREFILYLESKGNNIGGQLVYHRSIKAFLNWYWDEIEPNSYNPILKVKPPKQQIAPIEGVTKEQVFLLLSKCGKDTFNGERDRTILALLFDTGLRAQELCDIELNHIDLIRCSIFIPKGKGRKPRTVFFGRATRKQLRKYLRHIKSDQYLFTSQTGEKLIYNALRQILRRLCLLAGIKEISLHDFRRGFALEAVRNNIDLLTVSRLLGHSDLSLLTRYVNQNKKDLEDKYKSAIDN